MCGRYTLIAPMKMLEELFQITILGDIPPRYNIAPGQPVVAVRPNAGGTPPGGQLSLPDLGEGLDRSFVLSPPRPRRDPETDFGAPPPQAMRQPGGPPRFPLRDFV